MPISPTSIFVFLDMYLYWSHLLFLIHLKFLKKMPRLYSEFSLLPLIVVLIFGYLFFLYTRLSISLFIIFMIISYCLLWWIDFSLMIWRCKKYTQLMMRLTILFHLEILKWTNCRHWFLFIHILSLLLSALVCIHRSHLHEACLRFSNLK